VNPRPGYVTREHVIQVPLDHADPGSAPLEVFAREVVLPDKATDDRPCLLYLQGGPGGKAPRPVDTEGWLGAALETHRLVLLDQRGTGRSSPVTAATIGDMPAAEQAAYLRHFRADSIVADAELLRRRLLGDDGRWDTLGQSYGGFLTLAYLSQAPQGLRRCHITGGVPPLTATADDVYRRTYPRVAARTREFYARYPDDARAVRRIADRLAADDVRLPDGDRLTVRRLRLLGSMLGMNPGMERLHWLLDDAWHGSRLSEEFLASVWLSTAYLDGPIYALQEFCYGQGSATRWAAERVMQSLPEFAPEADPLLLTGEMMFPWMFEDIRLLRPFREAAEELAQFADWPVLYDADQLARNDVPVAAAVYFDDLYVESGYQLETAAVVGNMRAWVTNQWEHDGLLDADVFRRLRDMTAGVV
jgi:pimeloyl-ACP methyl ester carboxylesterase